MRFRCCVPGCHSVYGKKIGNVLISFFKLDLGDRRGVWVDKIGRPELLNSIHSNARICSLHFNDSDFKNDKRNRLRENAIPTKMLDLMGSNINLEEQLAVIIQYDLGVAGAKPSRSVACQTTDDYGASTPTEHLLERENERLKEYIEILKRNQFTDRDFKKFCDDNFNEEVANYMKTELQLCREYEIS